MNQESIDVHRELTTVENIENAMGVHEYMGHGIERFRTNNGTHYKAYELQLEHRSWEKTTPYFRSQMTIRYGGYIKRENHRLYRKEHSRIIKHW